MDGKAPGAARPFGIPVLLIAQPVLRDRVARVLGEDGPVRRGVGDEDEARIEGQVQPFMPVTSGAFRRINNPPPYAVRLEAATLAQLGRLDEAKAKAEEFRRMEPTWKLSLSARWPYRYPEDRELKLDGLRKAGFLE